MTAMTCFLPHLPRSSCTGSELINLLRKRRYAPIMHLSDYVDIIKTVEQAPAHLLPKDHCCETSAVPTWATWTMDVALPDQVAYDSRLSLCRAWMDAYKASPQDSSSSAFSSRSSTDTIPFFPDVPDMIDPFIGHPMPMPYTPSKSHASASVSPLSRSQF